MCENIKQFNQRNRCSSALPSAIAFLLENCMKLAIIWLIETLWLKLAISWLTETVQFVYMTMLVTFIHASYFCITPLSWSVLLKGHDMYFNFPVSFCFQNRAFELARIRTWNLLIRSQTRYPLRHKPPHTFKIGAQKSGEFKRTHHGAKVLSGELFGIFLGSWLIQWSCKVAKTVLHSQVISFHSQYAQGSNPGHGSGIASAFVKFALQPLLEECSRVAQWKRAGPITQRSVDRNHALLKPVFHLWKTPCIT